MDDYRLYTFVNNVYMSPIQWGIQSAHVVSTLMLKYRNSYAVETWAANSPTIIVCKGGNLETLKQKAQTIFEIWTELGLPYATFNEDEASLGGVLTCVGVLVPRMYFAAEYENKMNTVLPPYSGQPMHCYRVNGRQVDSVRDPTEFKLISFIQSAQLA